MTAEPFAIEEEDSITELRNRMKDDLPPENLKDDWYFYKFLKARNFNVNDAEYMLRKNLDWRKSYQMENILTIYEAPMVVKKYVPQSLLGVDKEGCPIRYCPIGAMDTKGIFRVTNKEDILKYILQTIEFDTKLLFKYQSKKIGKPVRQCIYIYNLENFSLAKALHTKSIEYFTMGIGIFQDNFPELLKHIFIINASGYFTAIFPIVKAVMTGSILNKIHLYGQEGWQEELLKHIDADVLPAFLGGKKTDPDGNPMCDTFIKHGLMIPEEYYLTKESDLMLEKPGCRTVFVDRRDLVHIPLLVREAGSVIEWEFLSVRSSDIKFGIAYRLQNDELEYVIPVHKLDTEYTPECGCVRVDRAGEYVVIFDNTYSWIYTKDIYYRVIVVDPEQQRIDLQLIQQSHNAK